MCPSSQGQPGCPPFCLYGSIATAFGAIPDYHLFPLLSILFALFVILVASAGKSISCDMCFHLYPSQLRVLHIEI